LDIVGISVAVSLVLCVVYGGILVIMLSIIDYDRITKEDIYPIKLLENEKIIYCIGDSLKINSNKELYYKCKLNNCSSFIIRTVQQKAKNSIFAKNLSPDTFYEYDIK
jgi:hypothetical protein